MIKSPLNTHLGNFSNENENSAIFLNSNSNSLQEKVVLLTTELERVTFAYKSLKIKHKKSCENKGFFIFVLMIIFF